MNRRNFFTTIAAALGWSVAPKLVKALVPAPVEFTATEWEWEPLYALPPKPSTIVWRRPPGATAWMIHSISTSETPGRYITPWPKQGEAFFATGYDPETGCMDMEPPEFLFPESANNA